jgi:starch synthase (maltosyl-transferring)
MSNEFHLTFEPTPGSKLLRYRGDTITFILTSTDPLKGCAFLRTNLGSGSVVRQQIIAAVEQKVPHTGRDWYDIPMSEVTPKQFQLRLPLSEVGHFEAKALLIPRGQTEPIWVPGANVTINVEPADTCCGNIIYNAFVRQFGTNKMIRDPAAGQAEAVALLDDTGYHVIPPSGTFRDLIHELDFIIGKLGCRFIQLLPIHPTPTTYGRMGRYGSPYAALSFTAVDPSLAEFDSRATPLEQFLELVMAIHARNAKILLDIAINHTGWAASLHETHPDWLVRSDQGNIEVPGAWGVRWEDLTKLNYQHKGLWQYMANVFLTWCHRGVDGFRCDAGYMIPASVWRYIIALVREQFPDTIFFLEGLGGKIAVTRNLLDSANFNWAYSEIFQNYHQREIANQLELGMDISYGQGLMVHYAETHDNPRLASRSQTWAKMRTALCALSSFQGAFGFANGVEWFATQKINVHESSSLNWNATENQVDHIRQLSCLLKYHPAFYDGTRMYVIDHASDDILIFLRHHQASGKKLLIVVNLDDSRTRRAVWQSMEMFAKPENWLDLMTGQTVRPHVDHRTVSMDLLPGQVLCISNDGGDPLDTRKSSIDHFQVPDRISHQRLRSKALEVFQVYHDFGDMGDWDLEASIKRLQSDPLDFCRQTNTQSRESRTIQWGWPRDSRREVMLPPAHFLLVQSPHPFQVTVSCHQILMGNEKSLWSQKGFHWALFKPFPIPDEPRVLTLKMSVYAGDDYQQSEARLMLLPADTPAIDLRYPRSVIDDSNFRMLSSNDLGADCFVPLAWGRQYGRYDAILAANLNLNLPVDRWIMFTRLGAWVVYQDYSQSLNLDCLASFALDGALRGVWTFHVPTGCGTHVVLRLKIVLEKSSNRVQLELLRCPAGAKQGRLSDSEPIEIILRPDIENRSFHENIKAYQEVEKSWPQAVSRHENGFVFHPDGLHILSMHLPGGVYVHEPEWRYMVHRAEDESRGFDPHGDLFSPGYFKTRIRGGEVSCLQAAVCGPDEKTLRDDYVKEPAPKCGTKHDDTEPIPAVQKILESALKQFVVRRGSLSTIIAGYPWFLDWGRDAIIVTRALIALGETAQARRVLKLFGGFEENGSLPNMLQGTRPANRDTSDAPLWFIVASRDLIEKEGNRSWLKEMCGQRTIQEIIKTIAMAYIRGTVNGIRMDPETALVYSPSHYTWMDTNHPAGTPREGYPIEIQALWYGALEFLCHVDPRDGYWAELAEQVRTSIDDFFWLSSEHYLCDCLHAGQGTPVRDAEVDDALRPNQLLAITMQAMLQPDRSRELMESCQELLIPGAIRSLADRSLCRPLEIMLNGQRLCDPHAPYRGRYEGDEDTHRKPAYHNGTAWTWLFPSFCEAWVMVFGPAAHQTAKAWLASVTSLLQQGCIGHVPEILDGDFPHNQRGCPAQAWGVSEALRVWLKLG